MGAFTSRFRAGFSRADRRAATMGSAYGSTCGTGVARIGTGAYQGYADRRDTRDAAMGARQKHGARRSARTGKRRRRRRRPRPLTPPSLQEAAADKGLAPPLFKNTETLHIWLLEVGLITAAKSKSGVRCSRLG